MDRPIDSRTSKEPTVLCWHPREPTLIIGWHDGELVLRAPANSQWPPFYGKQGPLGVAARVVPGMLSEALLRC